MFCVWIVMSRIDAHLELGVLSLGRDKATTFRSGSSELGGGILDTLCFLDKLNSLYRGCAITGRTNVQVQSVVVVV